jgi:RNA polymerase sigma factor (TIGR02999 family)
MAGGQVTQLLARWRAGDRAAADHLLPLVYEELRQVARRQMSRESPAHTLSATALVHEVYLRLMQQRQLSAVDRESFLGIAGLTMRRILVDHARARCRGKRGGGLRPVPLDEDAALLTEREAEEVLAVDLALERLAALDERAARVVESRVFAGLTLQETARALNLSVKSVQRTWLTARAWLRHEVASASLPE